MSIIANASGEGLPVSLRHDVGYVGLTNEEIAEFSCEPTARFLIRERIPGRDINLSGWQSESKGRGARRLVIVFRSGFQYEMHESPGFLPLARIIREARLALARWPDLGADAVPDASPCFFLWPSRAAGSRALLAEWPVPPVVSEFWYVDAPGDWSMGVYGVRLYKHFDARALTTNERYTLGAFQAMVDRWRRYDRVFFEGYTGPLPYPRKLLTQRRRRAEP